MSLECIKASHCHIAYYFTLSSSFTQPRQQDSEHMNTVFVFNKTRLGIKNSLRQIYKKLQATQGKGQTTEEKKR
jgi:hypothetical protein